MTPFTVDGRLVVRRLGLPGLATVAILAWVGWTQWVVVPALDEDIASLQHNMQAVKTRAATPQSSGPAGTALLHTLLAGLPDDSVSNETLATLLQQAKSDGLILDTVQFQVEPTRLPGVIRHRASLPLKGSYASLRGWLAQALGDNGGVTLDAVEVSRRDANTSDVEAHVTLSLWARTSAVRADTAGGAPRAH